MVRRVCLVAVLAVAASGCGGAARVGGSAVKPQVLTMLYPIADDQEALVYAQAVARLSHGALRLRVVPAGHERQTDYEARTIRDIRRGRAVLAWAGARAWDAVGVRAMRALVAPLLIDSYPLQQRVVQDPLAAQLLDGLRPLGLVGLGLWPGPLRRIVGTSGPLLAPADFDGRVLGTQQSAVADATMRALGARPQRLGSIVDLNALGGVEAQVGTVNGFKLDKPGMHISANVDLWPRTLVVFANARLFARLSAADRRILRDAATAVIPRFTAFQRSADAEATGDLCRRGRAAFHRASPAQLAALRRAVEPVYRDLERDPATRAAIDTITALKQRLAQPPDDLRRCAHAVATPQPKHTILDGTWVMDTRRRDAGPDFLAENWGHYVYVFAGGHFVNTQENGAACTWGYGTFTVTRNRTTWLFTDGGGPKAPNQAFNKPGESFVFGLSRFHDTLTLSPVHGFISPTNFRARAWRRLPGKPSTAPLSTHCPPPPAALSNLGVR